MRNLTALIGSVVVAAVAAAAPAPEPVEKGTYLVVYRPGPNWLAGKPVAEQPLKDHGRYLIELYRKGTLKFAGPFLDDTGGAMILVADNEADASAIVAADPAVVGKIMVGEIHPWRMVDWEQYVKKGPA